MWNENSRYRWIIVAAGRITSAILVLELEDMVVRLVCPPKLAGFHGYRSTVRLGISNVRCPADEISRWLQPRECHAGIDALSNPGSTSL
jgi:hypothetical protein